MKPSYPLYPSHVLFHSVSFLSLYLSRSSSIFPFSRATPHGIVRSLPPFPPAPPAGATVAPSLLRLFLSPIRLPTVFSLASSVSTLYGAAVSAAAAATAATAQVHDAMHSRGECIALDRGACFVALTNKASSHRENKYEMNYRWMLINGYFGELCCARMACARGKMSSPPPPLSSACPSHAAQKLSGIIVSILSCLRALFFHFRPASFSSMPLQRESRGVSKLLIGQNFGCAYQRGG